MVAKLPDEIIHIIIAQAILRYHVRLYLPQQFTGAGRFTVIGRLDCRKISIVVTRIHNGAS